MRRWRIFYDDGSTCDSSSVPLENTHCDGVIVIAQEDADVGRELLHLKDFYYWDDRWVGCDLYGLFDYLRRAGWKKIVAGRNTTHANYHALMDRARLDPWLPYKTARLTGEIPPRV